MTEKMELKIFGPILFKLDTIFQVSESYNSRETVSQLVDFRFFEFWGKLQNPYLGFISIDNLNDITIYLKFFWTKNVCLHVLSILYVHLKLIYIFF